MPPILTLLAAPVKGDGEIMVPFQVELLTGAMLGSILPAETGSEVHIGVASTRVEVTVMSLATLVVVDSGAAAAGVVSAGPARAKPAAAHCERAKAAAA